MKKIRCLFISHTPCGSIFEAGAGNSLRTFLMNQEFLYADLLLPLYFWQFLKWPQIIKQARKIRSSHILHVYFLPLPIDNCHEHSPTSMKAKAGYFLNNIIAFFFRPITDALIKRREYDFVHLNSFVLHQLITDTKKFTVHVRELLKRENPRASRAINNLSNANGLIFIDWRTQHSFMEFAPEKKLPFNRIINNPFDMEKAILLRQDKRELLQKYGLGNFSGKLFACFGMLHPIKGTDLIINAFIKADMENAKLLIVGAGNTDYTKYCLSLAQKKSDQIHFTGRLNFNEVLEVYAINDFVVRGDPDFRIGRTIYEGLYAGNYAIIPGELKSATQREVSLNLFSSRIFFYRPRKAESLTEAMKTAYKTELHPLSNIPSGNINQHCKQIEEFLTDCIYA